MHEVKDDKASFPVHTIDLDNVKVLIRPEQAEGAKGKNIIIGEPRPKNINDKIQVREVTTEDHCQNFKARGGRKFLSKDESACNSGTTGQTGRLNRSDKRPAQNFQT